MGLPSQALRVHDSPGSDPRSRGVQNMIRKLALTAIAAVSALVTTSCAMNPATGRPNVVLTSTEGEREQSRRYYQQIIQAYGLYEVQAVQDYVTRVGQKVAKNSHLGD